MAEKELEVRQVAHSNVVATLADEESAMTSDQLQARRLHRKRFNQLVAALVICVLLITLVSVTLDHTVFNFRTPMYRLSSVRINNLNATNSKNSTSSFNMELNAEIIMKNKNYAPYKYEWGYLTFSYDDVSVGDTIVERSEVKSRSSESGSVKVNVTSKGVPNDTNLRRGIDSGKLKFSVKSELRGQIEMIKIIRQDKVVVLDCSVTIDLGAKTVQELLCN